MNIHNVYGKGKTMTELNFEAIGRCQYLKEELKEVLRKRDSAYSDLIHAYRKQENHEIYETVKYVDIEKMRISMNLLDEMNKKAILLVEEYNHWADKADKKKIEFAKY